MIRKLNILMIFLCFSVLVKGNDGTYYEVSMEELLQAMQSEQGYDLTATTNVARFNAKVLLYLVRHLQERNPMNVPLLIKHHYWFKAFLQRTGLTRKQAPLFAVLSYQYGQDMVVEYRKDHVIKNIEKGPEPNIAMNVKIWWCRGRRTPNQYSFYDTLAVPKLKVTNKRIITYRLLDFGDVIVYDDVHGLYGRPTSGILGFLFRLIGEGRAVQSRFIISKDGLQINRTHAKKGLFGVTSTVTIKPNGEAKKDLPPHRPDLKALEDKLKQPLKINYVPLPPSWLE
ncbi:MAG: hypothetical protein D6813_08565 [Calditrichaeota bacterium]|nr:MAG: hypothetical protein D6813_08565 [Calditrichota bacterium]